MKYSIKGKRLFLPINRTHILDISSGDVIAVEGFPGASHTWTDHDAEFMENNPDDDIFLVLERVADNQYKVSQVLFELPEQNAS